MRQMDTDEEGPQITQIFHTIPSSFADLLSVSSVVLCG